MSNIGRISLHEGTIDTTMYSGHMVIPITTGGRGSAFLGIK